MATPPVSICTNCRHPLTPDARFCPHCRHKRAAIVAPAAIAATPAQPAQPSATDDAATGIETPSPGAAHAAPAINIDTLLLQAKERIAKVQVFESGSKSTIVREGAQPRVDQSTGSAPKSYCPDLEVRYNASRVFVMGMLSHFDFEFKIIGDKLSELRVECQIKDNSGQVCRYEEKVTKKLQAGMHFTQKLNFKPNFWGDSAFTFYIWYRKDGEWQRYENECDHKIFPQESKAGEVVTSQINNLHIEVTTGHASDVHIQDAKKYLDELKASTAGDDPLWKILDRLASIPPAMAFFELYPSEIEDGGASYSAIPRNQPPKITLRWNDTRIHLLSMATSQLGRNKQCDIVTRFFPTGGAEPIHEADKISKFHCRIEIHGQHAYVIDRGYNPADGLDKDSACGTFLDGKPIPRGQNREVPLNRHVALTLAGPSSSDHYAFALDLYAWRCSDQTHQDCRAAAACDETPGCVIMRRKDGVPEIYVMVHKCFPVELVDPALKGLTIVNEQGALRYRLHSNRGWCAPGQELHCNGRAISFDAFQQFGL